LTVKLELIEFWFGFELYPILKDGDEIGDEDIDTHPELFLEPALFI
jgi:hypothetical protein